MASDENHDFPSPSLEQKLEPTSTALIVVDVQNAWCHPEGVRFMQRSPELLASLKAALHLLIDSARGAGVLVVFVRMAHDLVYLSPAYAEQLRIQNSYGCLAAGSWDAEYWDDIRPRAEAREVEVTKHRYSAFNRTNLDLILRSNGVRTIVVAGVATGGCVFATALDGFLNDYYAFIASDAVADRDPTVHEVFLRRFQESCGDVLSSTRIAEAWKGCPGMLLAFAGDSGEHRSGS